MKVILQKVSRASVSVGGEEKAAIGEGYLLLLGVIQGDIEASIHPLADKIAGLRLFPSSEGKINDRSIIDIGGEILVVSQFTLAGKLEKGNRPDYTAAAERGEAERLYLRFIEELRSVGVKRVEHGVFGAEMAVSLVNQGPVTLILER
jgi:D-aminoacyl-tRNA deacylase